MGQTGYTSAIGLAVESQFRTVPLSGSSSPYSIGKAGTNPLRYCIVEPSIGIQGDPEIDSSKEVDGDVQERRMTLTGKVYQGDVTLKMDPENAYYLLLGQFGRDAQTALTSPAFQHVFTPDKYIPSFTCEEDLGDGTSGRLTSGVFVQHLEIDLGKIVTLKAKLYGHRQIPNSYPNSSGVYTKTLFGVVPSTLPTQMGGDGAKTVERTATPGYVDIAQGQSGNGPLTFASLELGFGTQSGFSASRLNIDGVAVPVEILEGTKIVIDREIDSRQVAGSGYDRGAVTANKFVVTGQLVALYEDMTLPSAALDFDQVALDLLFTGPPIGSSGSNYSFEIHLPHIKLNRAPVGETGGTIVINSDFATLKDPGLGYAIKAILVNTFDNAELAGQYVPPCVTTAIIPNNTEHLFPVNTSAGFLVGDTIMIAGANANPYTISALPDATHIDVGVSSLIQGNVAAGAAVTLANGRQYGSGGLDGWQSS